MATIRVSLDLLDEMLFKGLDAHITNAVANSHNAWVEFEGKDVPAEAEAVVIVTKYNYPGADPYSTIEIRAAL